jgi:hypothetical protein
MGSVGKPYTDLGKDEPPGSEKNKEWGQQTGSRISPAVEKQV